MLTRSRESKKESEEEQLLPTQSPNGLHFYHELPSWQHDNHYIRSGYVRETRSYCECSRALSYLNNETINILSHLVPAIYSLIFFSFFLDTVIPAHEEHWWVKFDFMLFGIGLVTCLSLSALFHTFKCHSPIVCKFGNQCDYFGIVIMITCSLVSMLSFIFHEDLSYCIIFTFLFLVLGMICTVTTFDSKFSTPYYRPFRSAMFILFGLSGIFPVIGAVHLYGLEDAIRRSGAIWLFSEGFFYILGACLYAMRIPEKWVYNETHDKNTVGKYDFFGSLHQIFHFMVIIAAYCHWRGLFASYIDWKSRNLSLRT